MKDVTDVMRKRLDKPFPEMSARQFSWAPATDKSPALDTWKLSVQRGVLGSMSRADAKRIVECWNALRYAEEPAAYVLSLIESDRIVRESLKIAAVAVERAERAEAELRDIKKDLG